MKVQLNTISIALMAVLTLGAGQVLATSDTATEMQKMEGHMKADEMKKMDGDMQANAMEKMEGMKDDAMEKMDDMQGDMKKKHDMKTDTAGS